MKNDIYEIILDGANSMDDISRFLITKPSIQEFNRINQTDFSAEDFCQAFESIKIDAENAPLVRLENLAKKQDFNQNSGNRVYLKFALSWDIEQIEGLTGISLAEAREIIEEQGTLF